VLDCLWALVCNFHQTARTKCYSNNSLDEAQCVFVHCKSRFLRTALMFHGIPRKKEKQHSFQVLHSLRCVVRLLICTMLQPLCLCQVLVLLVLIPVQENTPIKLLTVLCSCTWVHSHIPYTMTPLKKIKKLIEFQLNLL